MLRTKPPVASLSFYRSLACGLTNKIDRCMLNSELYAYIYVLFNFFVENSEKTGREVKFSTTAYIQTKIYPIKLLNHESLIQKLTWFLFLSLKKDKVKNI